MSYCHRCGNRTTSTDNVCIKCGAYLRKHSSHGKNSSINVIIRATLLIALVLFFVYLLNRFGI